MEEDDESIVELNGSDMLLEEIAMVLKEDEKIMFPKIGWKMESDSTDGQRFLNFLQASELDEKAHRLSEVDQTITQPLTITQRKLDSLDRQKATTSVFGLLSLQMIQRTVKQLSEMNPEEIKDALTPLNGLIDITKQA